MFAKVYVFTQFLPLHICWAYVSNIWRMVAEVAKKLCFRPWKSWIFKRNLMFDLWLHFCVLLHLLFTNFEAQVCSTVWHLRHQRVWGSFLKIWCSVWNITYLLTAPVLYIAASNEAESRAKNSWSIRIAEH